MTQDTDKSAASMVADRLAKLASIMGMDKGDNGTYWVDLPNGKLLMIRTDQDDPTMLLAQVVSPEADGDKECTIEACLSLDPNWAP